MYQYFISPISSPIYDYTWTNNLGLHTQFTEITACQCTNGFNKYTCLQYL